MSYEYKIQKELDKHDQQWCDAVCPSVAKYGKQADKRIALLEKVAEAAEVLHKELKREEIWLGTYDLPRALRAAGYLGGGDE
jgi:hypothetical protein